ncbi:hypothetical protein [Streptomyces oceani]|uniref:PPE family domain-containing protein n=1 Tax=Streptomyces oceani TaxID=1075402 RepID=A0A1E7JXI1_9ACTN|nr:hypothetical protein [Streptomyces oceani]OEU96383.1 hypothetical protein AN216_20490 [Streptomyces oceani]
MSGDFHKSVDAILSANGYAMKAAAGAWAALAGSATRSGDELRGVAESTAAEPGVGLPELADRLDQVGGWGTGAASLAMTISSQLRKAGDASSKAAERAHSLLAEYEAEEAASAEKGDDAASGGSVAPVQADKAIAMHGGRKAQLAKEAAGELAGLDAVFGTVLGGTAPSAPEVGAASGAGSPGAAATHRAGGAEGPVAGGSGPTVLAANGATVGGGSYPYSSVVGPSGGDFAGWVESPNTGYLVDPATGREFDPATGRWIDPLTGKPFGAVTEYATQLAGLGGGPGALAGPSGVSLAALGGTAASGSAHLGGMYGGAVPPSIANGGASQARLGQQAFQNMSHKADVANRFATREAAQGGRPYMPPPAAGAGAAGAGAGTRRSGTGGGSRYLREQPSTWRARAADASARHRLAESPAPARPAAGTARPVPGPAPAAGGGRTGGERRRNNRDRDRDRNQEGRGQPDDRDPGTETRRRGPGRGVLGE